jgi:hypothetical protein
VRHCEHKGVERSTPSKVLGARAHQRTLKMARGGDVADGGVRRSSAAHGGR